MIFTYSLASLGAMVGSNIGTALSVSTMNLKETEGHAPNPEGPLFMFMFTVTMLGALGMLVGGGVGYAIDSVTKFNGINYLDRMKIKASFFFRGETLDHPYSAQDYRELLKEELDTVDHMIALGQEIPSFGIGLEDSDNAAVGGSVPAGGSSLLFS